MNKLSADCNGSSMVEFTLVFSLLLVVALGTVDVAYLLYEWGLANKAAYRGARQAVVRNPVTADVTNLAYGAGDIGDVCFNPATGAAASPAKCPTFIYTCTSPANAMACPNFDNANFTAILQQMQLVFPRLQAGNVEIRYETIGLGFAGRPGGLPMSVTVSIRCMTHRLYFLGGLAGWTFQALPITCPPGQPAGPRIPAFATTLPSEDIETN